MRTITLRYDATCADCGVPLIPGDRAKYYGPGKVYGVDCHTRSESLERAIERPRALHEHELENWAPGRIASHYDPRGAYTPDGTYLGHGGPRCEDAPCCGCCP